MHAACTKEPPPQKHVLCAHLSCSLRALHESLNTLCLTRTVYVVCFDGSHTRPDTNTAPRHRWGHFTMLYNITRSGGGLRTRAYIITRSVHGWRPNWAVSSITVTATQRIVSKCERMLQHE